MSIMLKVVLYNMNWEPVYLYVYWYKIKQGISTEKANKRKMYVSVFG